MREPRLIALEPLLFLFDHVSQVAAQDGIRPDCLLVQDDHPPFGQCAKRKLAMQRVPNFPYDQYIQRQVERPSDLSRHHNAATRQSQNKISFYLPVI
jgi:hypothetical protein